MLILLKFGNTIKVGIYYFKFGFINNYEKRFRKTLVIDRRKTLVIDRLAMLTDPNIDYC